MIMVRLSNHQKLSLFLGSVLLVILLIIWLGVLPLIQKIKETSARYLANEQTLTRLAQRETTIKQLQQNYQAIEADFSKIAHVFLSLDEVVDFVTTLERIAQQTNNQFKMDVLNQPSQSEESFLLFRITLQGNFNNLLNFLANLEDTPYPPYRIIGLESLSINQSPTGQEKSGQLESILDIKLYLNKGLVKE